MKQSRLDTVATEQMDHVTGAVDWGRVGERAWDGTAKLGVFAAATAAIFRRGRGSRYMAAGRALRNFAPVGAVLGGGLEAYRQSRE